jgi:hypothetical protein
MNIDNIAKIMTVICIVDLSIVGIITRMSLGNFDLMDIWFVWIHVIPVFAIWIVIVIKWYKNSPPEKSMYMSNGKKRGWF